MAICELLVLADKILKKAFSTQYYLILGDVRIFHTIQEEFSKKDLRDIIIKRDLYNLTSLMKERGWQGKDAFLFARSLLYCKGYEELIGSLNKLKSKATEDQKKFLDKIMER